MLQQSRRGFLLGLLAAPVIVKASSLMPISVRRELPPGVFTEAELLKIMEELGRARVLTEGRSTSYDFGVRRL